MVDSKGLVTSNRDLNKLEHHKCAYTHQAPFLGKEEPTTLIDIINVIQPTAIFGLSSTPHSFTKEICEKMVEITKFKDKNTKPLIFALSNPTSKAECTARQAYEWCDGEVVFASGSPFDAVDIVNKGGEKASFFFSLFFFHFFFHF